MAVLAGIATGIGLFLLLATWADNYEPKSPTPTEWLRMVNEPGWTPEKQQQLDDQQHIQQLKDYMQQDLTKTWQQYL